ncbi:hypothetical protein HMPREF0860_0832 [Treponema socranskii subsp. socranskii VPI DR56BR1116 = ATCC 35536]|uniref:Uncharacterized protein n=1 Tax=Treponema socranskii subsp. socranskii VPI DR56BR1116 = ATCC 35536 TaxID=1125725 RepID=U2L155_TRESO|nr:hypothetical protein HMPREF1325_2122 [Treponema socranskii subsp. socranskii VPI DR56BR1116 = ATCC 35536]ERK04462.1 hypothetical protein HMPREF0860_0832 [Treponema socranskii subsp. socranskii VPI DR56BR1116 = ATCC 35536]
MKPVRTAQALKNVHDFCGHAPRAIRYELLIINFGVCGVVYV